ncbi:MAG: type II toxin-antitoxin system YafQ family toxin [Clostridiales Family XIII bacterium]|jgi:mRNA interferase YafQ|nr:type II toxin-antitoxin system YafQ family toxin [Clostridiales Family XIII bacterium]
MSKYRIKSTSTFKKDLKRLLRQGKDISELDAAIATLADGLSLDDRYLDHPLSGNWKGFRDCHIAPDWILLYKIEADILVLTLTRSGSHSDLKL